MDDSGAMLIAIVIVGIILFIIKSALSSVVVSNAEPKKELYLSLLSDLSEDPTNAELKSRTLHAGRLYYSSVLVEDEMVIHNDIMSACAGAVKNVDSSNDDVYEQLKKLAELKDKGIINEDEYNDKKASLLEKI